MKFPWVMLQRQMGDYTRKSYKVVLTGATGFIGRHLQNKLLDRGHKCTAYIRTRSKYSDSISSGIKIIEGELTDLQALTIALSDADFVIYCAGSVRGLTTDDFQVANVDGLRNIVEATKNHRKCRFILISSLAASKPYISNYARSKRAGEKVLLGRAGLEWVIFRPPAIYGPGDREMKPIFRMIRSGLAPLIGPKEQRLSLLYVEDFANAVVDAVEKFDQCGGKIYEIDDGRPLGYSWFDIIAGARGNCHPVVKIRISPKLLFYIAVINEHVAKTLNYRPMLTVGKVREIHEQEWLCDNGDFTAATGWQAKFCLEEGLKLTFNRHHQRGS